MDVMAHGFADLVYDRQGGPRGDEKLFIASMAMAMGQRAVGPGTWALRTMFSLDPLMGRSGYPLLFQTGETADGVTPLVDRQHPHDFFVELATSYSVPIGAGSALFGYVGLPGEPALGPTTFMHRASGLQIPEAPLTHHWLDSTHITFGVVTLGTTWSDWKLEASAFNAREPDHNRWNIETDPLDSYAGRITFNPAPAWSMQASYGWLVAPEQLEPDENVHRTTASVSYSRPIAAGHWSSTAALGINRAHGTNHPAWLLESTRQFGTGWSVFGRIERMENEHLIQELPGEASKVGKLTAGGAYRVAAAGPLAFRLGALISAYAVPDELEAEYGSSPVSFMVFLRTSLE
jgi:hypothetical protein